MSYGQQFGRGQRSQGARSGGFSPHSTFSPPFSRFQTGEVLWLLQMEFYFSDSNQPTDKFLQKELISGRGWVNLAVDPEAVQAEVDARSIAADPLPYNITIEEVEAFFAEHGEVRSVHLPKHPRTTKCGMGIAFVEFSSQ